MPSSKNKKPSVTLEQKVLVVLFVLLFAGLSVLLAKDFTKKTEISDPNIVEQGQ